MVAVAVMTRRRGGEQEPDALGPIHLKSGSRSIGPVRLTKWRGKKEVLTGDFRGATLCGFVDDDKLSDHRRKLKGRDDTL